MPGDTKIPVILKMQKTSCTHKSSPLSTSSFVSFIKGTKTAKKYSQLYLPLLSNKEREATVASSLTCLTDLLLAWVNPCSRNLLHKIHTEVLVWWNTRQISPLTFIAPVHSSVNEYLAALEVTLYHWWSLPQFKSI